MRRIALQSAVGGMVLSIAGMMIAFGGTLPPAARAVCQEVIDLAAVLNALRAAVYGGELVDYASDFPESVTENRSIPIAVDG
jgi:hypothetical protein